MDEQKRPKVTRLVMFKHGVAYLERRGPAAGSFELSFRSDEMNDALKSITAWVVKGDARVTSFGFDVPERERGAPLGSGEALDGLIAALRGRTVEVEDGRDTERGEVLGLQQRTGAHGDQRTSLLLRTEAGAVAVVDLQRVHTLRLLDAVSRERLAQIVDRGRAATESDTRSLRVNLTGSADELRLAYITPAPMWRVTYRVVRDAEGATLMAMGIVLNPVDEDLEDIDLTLTTGQPVSFVIDLLHPREVRRPVLEEEARAAAPPTRHERGAAPARKASPLACGAGASERFTYGGAEVLGDMLESAEEASEGVERGELFEYHLKTPVSMHRGGAAVVPLAAARVGATREILWRAGMGRHPDLVIAFENDSGLVLEEGPAVIYDEGVYAGESMMPYSPRGAPVKMTFAKDLAVRVTSNTQVSTVVAGVRIVEDGLLEERRQEQLHTVEAESDHEAAIKLIVEIPRSSGYTLSDDSPKPFEETIHHRRFEIEVPAHGRATLQVREVRALSRRVTLESVEAADVERWFRDKHLDDATYRALSGLLALRDEIRALEQQKKRAEAEQAAAYAKQTKLSEQLAVLKESGPEGALRLRYVKELEAEQDKVNAAEAEIRRLVAAIEDTRRRSREALARLVTP